MTRQFILPLAHELVVDLFAGGGGASTGIEQALGRHVDIAVNHDPEAVSLHQANHPQTRHFVSDVFEVDPLAVTEAAAVLAALLMHAKHPATPNSPRWVSIMVPEDFIDAAEAALAAEAGPVFPKAPEISEADVPY